MFTRSIVLFPYGMAEGVVDSPIGPERAHEFCVRCATVCGEFPPTFVTNASSALNDFFPLIEARRRDICSPQTQSIVMLTVTNPISAVLNARTRLEAAFPSLKDAMWVVFVGLFLESFPAIARRRGAFHGEFESVPLWRSDLGDFLVLSPRIAELSFLVNAAQRYWRRTPSQVLSIRPGSLTRIKKP